MMTFLHRRSMTPDLASNDDSRPASEIALFMFIDRPSIGQYAPIQSRVF